LQFKSIFYQTYHIDSDETLCRMIKLPASSLFPDRNTV
jgi:hypothetical protein